MGEKFQEIVGGADHGPLGTYFLDAAQQKLAEAACLFDLSEHRLHHLLSQSVRRFEAAVVDLFAHQFTRPILQQKSNTLRNAALRMSKPSNWGAYGPFLPSRC